MVNCAMKHNTTGAIQHRELRQKKNDDAILHIMKTVRGHTKEVTVFMILLLLLVPTVLAAELRLTYDANGNLVTGDGTYRVYNSMNKLWKVYNGSDTSGPLLEEITHDPDENRVIIITVIRHDFLLILFPFIILFAE